jgi:hypothetical protein
MVDIAMTEEKRMLILTFKQWAQLRAASLDLLLDIGGEWIELPAPPKHTDSDFYAMERLYRGMNNIALEQENRINELENWRPACFGYGPYSPCERSDDLPKECKVCPAHKKNRANAEKRP